MGILDKVFGSSSTSDDKWLIYTKCAMVLAHVDGDTSEKEVHGAVARLHQRGGLSRDKINSLIDRASNEDFDAAIERAKSTLSEDEKLDLVNFLIGNAQDDGYFHGEEVVFIAWVGAQFDMDADALIAHMVAEESYENVDIEEVKKALERFKQD
tara:strand:- start:1358 stop:1819 length:462 start_codon:yes stop_codon:yes gene_type:complete